MISRSPLLFRACEIVANILAGTRSPYLLVSIDIGPMECPKCGDQMTIGDLVTNPLVCPECESHSTRSIWGDAPATSLVDYWPLDGKEIRRVIRHLKEMAGHSRDSYFEGKLAVPVLERRASLWDRDLDGLE